MVDLPKKKVGIVACSGEELAEGTVTRLAALRVLEQLRPNETVTICLPLFLAGGEGDRAFARFYPTISIDGCELRCAQKATEKYSNKPAVSIMVKDLLEANGLGQPEGKRRLNKAGLLAVECVEKEIAGAVDELMEKGWNRRLGEMVELRTIDEPEGAAVAEPAVATCACGSGIPVQNIIVAGKEVTLAGLPLIFQQFIEANKAPNDANLSELMETIKIYNPIPAEEEPVYREGVREAYSSQWFKEKSR